MDDITRFTRVQDPAVEAWRKVLDAGEGRPVAQ
jgi:hypothetical protein